MESSGGRNADSQDGSALRHDTLPGRTPHFSVAILRLGDGFVNFDPLGKKDRPHSAPAPLGTPSVEVSKGIIGAALAIVLRSRSKGKIEERRKNVETDVMGTIVIHSG